MTTHDTPEAVCAAALEFIDVRYQGIFSSASGPGPQELAAAILAAMPGWTLVPRVATADWTGSTRKDAELARLRAAIQAVLDDAESQHPGGWGPDVTTVAFLRAALGPSEP